MDCKTVPYDAAVSGPAAGCGVEVADGPDGVREKPVLLIGHVC